jgi:ATP-binding cassette subfamily D (ALD) long-chain fatty acid import protein
MSAAILERTRNLRPTTEQVSKLTAAYTKNRPTIQRFILAGFLVHVLRSTVTSFASGRSVSQKKSRSKGKQGEDGKPARVAVRIHLERNGTSMLKINRLTVFSTKG